MRGEDIQQDTLFSTVSPEQRVPKDHPLRPIRAMVNRALDAMSSDFSELYASTGRPSIPPEKMLRAQLLLILYSIRSDRQLMEQLNYNLLFRWFVGLSVDDPVWVASSFSHNRDRLLSTDIAKRFFDQVLHQADKAGLASHEHFSVDGTLIEAWASMKSVKPREPAQSDDGPPDPPKSTGEEEKKDISRNESVNFRGEKRTNETHASTTDPEAKLKKKSKGVASRLCFEGHVLMENRTGLVVDVRLTEASGKAEREAAIDMVEALPGTGRVTVGADKGYDTKGFAAAMRENNATPHVAQHDTHRKSAIDGRTTRHEGYATSLRVRKRVEEVFGWMKGIGGLRKTRFVGRAKVEAQCVFAAAAYNLVRMRSEGVRPC